MGFNIAVKVGLEGQLCEEVYPRCILALPELLRILRRQGISFDIPGQDRDCQVYFLWKKKKPSSIENEVPLDTDADADDTVLELAGSLNIMDEIFQWVGISSIINYVLLQFDM